MGKEPSKQALEKALEKEPLRHILPESGASHRREARAVFR
jgi:hypothetical protein